MVSATDLQPAQCILLAATLAADANIRSLRSLAASRRDCFDGDILLRILLSHLPETVEPSIYILLLAELIRDEDTSLDDSADLDCTAVAELSAEESRRQLRRLHLLPLRYPSGPPYTPDDPLTLFLIHRAHRIDSETGLFPLVPKLLQPFLDRSAYLRDWYVGVVLPHLRFDYEYYAQEDDSLTLEEFEALDGAPGVDKLLERVQQVGRRKETIGRDLRGVLAPWIYGHQRWMQMGEKNKRRRLEDDLSGPAVSDTAHEVSTTGEKGAWPLLNRWLVSTAKRDFPLAVQTVEDWSGPQDVDLGDVEELYQAFTLDEQEVEKAQKDYYRAAFATIYAAESDTPDTIDGAHSILVRLADLLGFEPPPDLATGIDLLPKIDRQKQQIYEPSLSFLQPETLMKSENPLTDPGTESFSLLQLLVHSAYLLAGLGYKTSIVKLAKLRFWSDDTEQAAVLRHIVDGLLQGGRTEDEWMYIRQTVLWLWDWATEHSPEIASLGYGVFGKISRDELEKHLVRLLCKAGQFNLVKKVYLKAGSDSPISKDVTEHTVIDLAYQYYDEASNGSRTRGSMKKAYDLIAIFKTQFVGSSAFERFGALIAATHSMASYSLILEKGVPFRPLEIRRSSDPVSLLDKILEQNPRSYTHLDNLIEIACELTKAFPPDGKSRDETQAQRLSTVERRVMSMAIEAALGEDDFETAYSYVVNRLTPSNDSNESASDDYSWRAAYLAGRQRPAVAVKGTSGTSGSTSPHVRRLEQRMELLSQSLLLAPSTVLPEILAAWRRCEEELLTVLANETEEEHEFDDCADRGEVSRDVPGSFGTTDNGFMVQPKRKELGRGAVEEAPMGLFDVARGAAAAFQRSAGGHRPNTGSHGDEQDEYGDLGGSGRQRKRDMVASAVTGSLASGIGWMLGATPVKEQDG